MLEYRDIHKNKRVFIVGNGASLVDTPMHLLNNEYSFGMNRIGLFFKQTDWRPDYFFCITYRVRMFNAYQRDVYRAIQTGVPSFIGNRIKTHIYGYDNIHYVDALHIGKNFLEPKDKYWNRDISDNKVSVYGQSLFSVMQIAVYMGFNPIYLVGIDGYIPNRDIEDTNHFDPRYEGVKQRHKLKWFNEYGLQVVNNSHNLIYKGTKAQGVDVFDATVVDNSTPYPKVDIKDLV